MLHPFQPKLCLQKTSNGTFNQTVLLLCSAVCTNSFLFICLKRKWLLKLTRPACPVSKNSSKLFFATTCKNGARFNDVFCIWDDCFLFVNTDISPFSFFLQCCAMKSQYCCSVIGCSLPCKDEYAPAMCTLLPFCAVYPTFGCCKHVGEIAPKMVRADGGAAPQLEMVR